MTFDKELVKERVSIRHLFERDGHKLKRAGTSLVCRCPAHEEKTSSCHVHENDGFFKCFGCDFKGDVFKYWEVTRGCDFKTALEQLAVLAGVSAEEVGTRSAECGMKLKAPKPAPEPVLAPKLDDGRDEAWLDACSLLMMNVEAQQRIAAWRGFSVETIRWAAEQRLMGLMDFMGAEREAFLVERPDGENDEIQMTKSETLVPIGWHVRLAPDSPGNEHPKKASWRYPWAGIGSWPFVMGDVATAKILFFMEGQWDGLALVDLMGWNGENDKIPMTNDQKGIPKGVAIVCMRGATSWKLFLKHYSWPEKATGFTIADADNAGRTWFEKDGFVEQLQPRLKRVIGFFPANAKAFKDFNDVHKAKEITRGQMSAILRGKMRKNLDKKRGKTFLKWCREQAGARADLIGKAAFLVVRDKKRPRGWKPLKVWERHWAKVMATEDIPHLRAAWEEWRKA